MMMVDVLNSTHKPIVTTTAENILNHKGNVSWLVFIQEGCLAVGLD